MNSSYICNCGCQVVFTVQSNMRGCLIKLTPDSYIIEDRLVGDTWTNYIGQLRTWSELKNKIISKNQNLINNNNNGANVWLHLYNQYIQRNIFADLSPQTQLQFVYIQICIN
jgi:hypothetical protein